MKSKSSSTRRWCALVLYGRILSTFRTSSAPSPLAAGHQPATMHHLHPLLFLVLLAASPPVATAATFDCVGGVYKANSTYEANLRRLAAVLPAETAASKGLHASRGVGYWPNRPRASSQCYWGVSSSSCAACVAGAFREAERACPYGKKAVVFARNCTLSLADFPRPLGFGVIALFHLEISS
ncbi:hypothetical protein D1007_46066 [Hordeum vulgare]|nr:hypothetical protein D1007_46066 [Hordeum vulgare]